MQAPARARRLRDLARSSAHVGRKLRTHSGRELIVAALRIAWAGEAGVQDRTLLGIWYAPRRADGSGPC